jgi:hypothetical protein
MIQAFIDDKLDEPNYAFAQARYKVAIKWLMAEGYTFDLEKISIIVIFPFDRDFVW